MSPLAFLARPSRWLRAIHRHRGTLSAAPNFAYELCVNKIPDEEIAGLDLSSWRMALNGAEPVSPEALRRFTERFAPHGFRPGAFSPVYGLAENSLAVAFPPLGRPPRDRRRRARRLPALGRGGPCPDGSRGRSAGPSASSPAACRCRATRSASSTTPAARWRSGRRGGWSSRGRPPTSGYFRNPEATAKLVHGDWRDSGDRAYLARRRGLHHRPGEGHHHPRRPQPLPAGAGGGGGRGAGRAQGVRGRLRQPRSGDRHRAAGGDGRDPRAGRGGAGDDPAGGPGGRRRPPRHARRRGGPGAAARACPRPRAARSGARRRARSTSPGRSGGGGGALGCRSPTWPSRGCGRRRRAASAPSASLLYAAWAYGSVALFADPALARRRAGAGVAPAAAAGARRRPLPVRLDRHPAPPGGRGEPGDGRAADRGGQPFELPGRHRADRPAAAGVRLRGEARAGEELHLADLPAPPGDALRRALRRRAERRRDPQGAGRPGSAASRSPSSPRGPSAATPASSPSAWATFAVAVDAGVPVVPVAIQGTRDAAARRRPPPPPRPR